VLHAPLAQGRLDLPEALKVLGRQGLTRVFCEGGPTLASALLDAGRVDTVVLMTGAHALGGPGLFALTPAARRCVADPACYSLAIDRPFGADRMRRYERIETCSLDS
jgi:diaminohydroxyphosphoribosylaminopyrimidine deaminase / 5-amino-6-(5-phosphoribosylamino)uracil reductase